MRVPDGHALIACIADARKRRAVQRRAAGHVAIGSRGVLRKIANRVTAK